MNKEYRFKEIETVILDKKNDVFKNEIRSALSTVVRNELILLQNRHVHAEKKGRISDSGSKIIKQHVVESKTGLGKKNATNLMARDIVSNFSKEIADPGKRETSSTEVAHKKEIERKLGQPPVVSKSTIDEITPDDSLNNVIHTDMHGVVNELINPPSQESLSSHGLPGNEEKNFIRIDMDGMLPHQLSRRTDATEGENNKKKSSNEIIRQKIIDETKKQPLAVEMSAEIELTSINLNTDVIQRDDNSAVNAQQMSEDERQKDGNEIVQQKMNNDEILQPVEGTSLSVNTHQHCSQINTIINEGKSNVIKELINPSLGETIKSKIVLNEEALKEKITIPKSTLYAEKIWGRPKKDSVVKRVGTGIYRQLESIAKSDESTGELSDAIRSQAEKRALRITRNTVIATGIAVSGVYHYGKYTATIVDDTKNGLMTGKEARLLALKRGGISLKSSGISILRSIKNETSRELKDFHGSDDLGIKAMTKSKDAIIQAREVIKLTKKIISNPIVMKGLLVAVVGVIVVLLMLAPILTVTSLIPTLSLKSEDSDLTKTYLYITEHDAQMTLNLQEIREKNEYSHIDRFHYYVNESSVNKSAFAVYTDTDMMLAYFDSKYDDFKFNGAVRSEIDRIHEELYSVTTEKWESQEEFSEEIDGRTHTWVETIHHLDIRLQAKSLADYITEHKDELLTEEGLDRIEGLREIGFYTFRKELETPFIGINISPSITSRFGWRIHPITNELDCHEAIDIAMAGGTPINAVMSGTVKVGYDESGYGNYVVINDNSGNGTLYAHMLSVSVVYGQAVKAGEVIGYVGSTGSSTGNHLHLEYQKNGTKLNPIFYIDTNG